MFPRRVSRSRFQVAFPGRVSRSRFQVAFLGRVSRSYFQVMFQGCVPKVPYLGYVSILSFYVTYLIYPT
jgi:hypothetical protein